MNLDPRAKYLFLFAHYDDDVFISGTMRMLLRAGAQVHGAWVTGCDYFGQATKRQVELQRAADILGLDESARRRLGFPDMGLLNSLDKAADRVARLISDLSPATVFVTAYEGGHPDHDAVNFLAYEGCRRAGANPHLFEFPLYNGTGPWHHWKWRIGSFPPDGPEALHNCLDSDAVRCKYRMMRTYSSQWMYMLPARLASSRSKLLRLGEPFRPCPPDRDHSEPPHPGQLNYERWFCRWMKVTFRDFRDAVLRARS